MNWQELAECTITQEKPTTRNWRRVRDADRKWMHYSQDERSTRSTHAPHWAQSVWSLYLQGNTDCGLTVVAKQTSSKHEYKSTAKHAKSQKACVHPMVRDPKASSKWMCISRKSKDKA